jgi:hypothetical protein
MNKYFYLYEEFLRSFDYRSGTRVTRQRRIRKGISFNQQPVASTEATEVIPQIDIHSLLILCALSCRDQSTEQEKHACSIEKSKIDKTAFLSENCHLFLLAFSHSNRIIPNLEIDASQ